MTIGERIRTKRESQQISQTDLATKIGVLKQTLYKYETNIVTNIPFDIIEKIRSDMLSSVKRSHIKGATTQFKRIGSFGKAG